MKIPPSGCNQNGIMVSQADYQGQSPVTKIRAQAILPHEWGNMGASRCMIATWARLVHLPLEDCADSIEYGPDEVSDAHYE
jgi:hypothetical protein